MGTMNVRAATAPVKPAVDPFACLPYHIGLAPQLEAIEVRIILSLLRYAKDKDVCWPSDRTIGRDVQRSRSTVQRHLRRLEETGYIIRMKSPNPNNRTGRILRLTWRCLAVATPPVSSVSVPPVSPVRHESEKEREKEKPATSSAWAGSRAEAGNADSDPMPTPDQIRVAFAAIMKRPVTQPNTDLPELAELRAARPKATSTPSKRPNLGKLNLSVHRGSSGHKGTHPQARQ
jgi:DNA-binding transcriptional MocR family regulator